MEHPLVTLKFRTDGSEIFVDQGEKLHEVGKRKGEQAWSVFLAPFLYGVGRTGVLTRIDLVGLS